MLQVPSCGVWVCVWCVCGGREGGVGVRVVCGVWDGRVCGCGCVGVVCGVEVGVWV